MDIKDFEPLFGNWFVDSFIGSGSFGKVYKIKREEFGAVYYSALKWISIPQDEAELKQLRYDGMDNASISEYYNDVVRDLTNEMHLMSRLRGRSSIVSYEDHCIVIKPNKMGYDIFIRMELLTSLNEYMLTHELSRTELIRLGVNLCEALELCQKFNIIHRDIKPDNIFIAETGEFKLGDFGIARQLEKTATGLSIKGTYYYMAPEVYKGEKYNSSVDVYSLGIVLYRLLNGGRLPFLPLAPDPVLPSVRDQSMVRRMGGEKMPFPLNAEDKLGEIILKACSYDPKDRYSSPKQMREELQAIKYSGEDAQFVVRGGDGLSAIESNGEQKQIAKSLAETDETEIALGRVPDPRIMPEAGKSAPVPGHVNFEKTHSAFADADQSGEANSNINADEGQTEQEKSESSRRLFDRATAGFASYSANTVNAADNNATESILSSRRTSAKDAESEQNSDALKDKSENTIQTSRNDKKRKSVWLGIAGISCIAIVIWLVSISANDGKTPLTAEPTDALVAMTNIPQTGSPEEQTNATGDVNSVSQTEPLHAQTKETGDVFVADSAQYKTVLRFCDCGIEDVWKDDTAAADEADISSGFSIGFAYMPAIISTLELRSAGIFTDLEGTAFSGTVSVYDSNGQYIDESNSNWYDTTKLPNGTYYTLASFQGYEDMRTDLFTIDHSLETGKQIRIEALAKISRSMLQGFKIYLENKDGTPVQSKRVEVKAVSPTGTESLSINNYQTNEAGIVCDGWDGEEQYVFFLDKSYDLRFQVDDGEWFDVTDILDGV